MSKYDINWIICLNYLFFCLDYILKNVILSSSEDVDEDSNRVALEREELSMCGLFFSAVTWEHVLRE